MAMEEKKWSYDDLQAYIKEENAEKAAKDVLPDHWPPNIKPDTGKTSPWLPAGWGQGLKESVNFNFHKVFISPEGKLYFNKRDIEKFLGRTLVDEPPPPKEDKPLPPRRDWPEWLPTDWFISQKMSADRYRIYYYSPTGKGFFNRAQAEDFMTKNPSPPGSTKPKAEAKPKAASSAEPKGSPSRRTSSKGRDPARDIAAKSETAKDTAAKAEPAKDTAAKAEPAKDTAVKSEPPSADGQQTSPTKRLRLDEAASTDDEVAQIEDGSEGDGYAIRECRKGAAWLVLPEDVLSLDLLALSVEIEGAGWSCSERGQHRCNFLGSPDLVLYDSGKLLVRSGEAEARRIAKQYVESWLLLDVPTEAMQV